MNRAARKSPDAGELMDFEVLTGGDVLLTVSDIEDRYGHPVRLTAAELAGIAEASAARRGQDHAGVAGLQARLDSYPAETANRRK